MIALAAIAECLVLRCICDILICHKMVDNRVSKVQNFFNLRNFIHIAKCYSSRVRHFSGNSIVCIVPFALCRNSGSLLFCYRSASNPPKFVCLWTSVRNSVIRLTPLAYSPCWARCLPPAFNFQLCTTFHSQSGYGSRFLPTCSSHTAGRKFPGATQATVHEIDLVNYRREHEYALHGRHVCHWIAWSGFIRGPPLMGSAPLWYYSSAGTFGLTVTV